MDADREICAGPAVVNCGPWSCPQLVIGHVELAGERIPVCAIHTRTLAHALLEMSFDIEVAGGKTRAELDAGKRLPRYIVEALERRKQKLAARAGG